MSFSTQELLDRSRKELLDLSTRNRLLSIPTGSKSARIIEVFDELSDQVFRIIYTDKREMSFLPGKGGKDVPTDLLLEEIGLPQPDETEDEATGLAKRHVDAKLQTSLSSEGLQRRLLSIFGDSRTMLEEQGVSILYLALGHLKWYEADQSDTPRYAPLILLPVELERKSASERFYLHLREEDLQENLSLRAKLDLDFNIKIPEFPDEEDLTPSKYFREFSKAIAGIKGWEVLPNSITLGFFSFAKFLMYRDLDAKNWPDGDQLLKHHFVTGLIQDGFPQPEGILGEDAHLDEVIPASRLDHVVDADSSQTLAIELVRQGHSLVIQGPPGTGKSQSITNLIASALLDKKKILFVAEKLAALEVVKRRLEKEGLGPLCLELHSNKASKRAVVEEIGRTWVLGRPKATVKESLVSLLEKRRGVLNKHVNALHKQIPPSNLTPFRMMGELALLGENGGGAVDVTFSGVETWTLEDKEEREQLVKDLASRIEQIGLPAKHPWRGVCKHPFLHIDLAPLETKIRSLLAQLTELRQTTTELALAIGQPIPTSFAQCEEQRIISDYVVKAPPLDKTALCNSVWNAGLDGLRHLICEGRKFVQLKTETKEQIIESAWEKNFTEIRTHIAAHGHSLFRFLNGQYRRAIADLRSVMVSGLPKTFEKRIELLDKLLEGQRCLRVIREGKALGESAFGVAWHQEDTNWEEVETVLKWVSGQQDVGLGASFREMFSEIQNVKEVEGLLARLTGKLSQAKDEAEKFVSTLSLDCEIAFQQKNLADVTLESLADKCNECLIKMESLLEWSNYHIRATRARELGLTQLVLHLENGKISTKAAIDCFQRIYFSQMLRQAVREEPDLAGFDGVAHEAIIEEFRDLDKERLALAKQRVLTTHFEAMPPHSGVGPAGILKSELERKRGHRPVRRLIREAGSVIQAIKPVFMMSPLSVSQFLEPGAVEFDLLIIDEASQVQPVDALGAVARCKQIVVLGDSKQLPPTRFFMRLSSDGSEEDDEEPISTAEAKDIESILGLCTARGLPQTMLRWHYRSRHHSLIAVSNHEFYEDRLFIVPSPLSSTTNLGLKFHPIPDGVFDSGASGTNRIEAKAICRAVMEHAKNSPQLSLGVAAFSMRQQQAILDELELLRRENPDLEEFFANHQTEPFFVKNLENVQGDERDVIFISIGYGRDVNGYMAMRFGPLSMEGGERRLNVLISRAKQRCEVFSSITADDIDLQRANGRGVAALKSFLAYAETGKLGISQVSGLDEQSPFEEAVKRELEGLGFEVHPQVGVAGFYIDLGVVDTNHPGSYLLGIECDGASYHSSRSARDRDRLRQAVLEDHGWIIHRIWSTDWFQRPSEQLRKLSEAIESAQTRKNRGAPSRTESSSKAESEIVIEREPEFELDERLVQFAVPYHEARFSVPHNQAPHEISQKCMADLLYRIIEEEGPIHEDELVVRIRDLWKLDRAGTRIQGAVAGAIRNLLVNRRCSRESDFLSIPGSNVQVRNRENVMSPNLRKPEMLPPSEIRAAILKLVEITHGATRQELPVAVARLFGFKSTSSQLKIAIDAQISKLLRQSLIQDSDGMLKLVSSSQ